MSKFCWIIFACGLLQVSGCAPLIFGTVGGGVAVLTDRRSTSVQAIDRALQIESARVLKEGFGQKINVNVSAFNRKLLLTGEVSTTEQALEVEKLVRETQNPRAVFNELLLVQANKKDTRLADTAVTSAVKAALVSTKGVPSNSMRITTFAGIVYLMGLVTEDEGKAAAFVASGVLGVAQVVKLFEYIPAAATKS